jgi:hypothetical protein
VFLALGFVGALWQQMRRISGILGRRRYDVMGLTLITVWTAVFAADDWVEPGCG